MSSVKDSMLGPAIRKCPSGIYKAGFELISPRKYCIMIVKSTLLEGQYIQ